MNFEQKKIEKETNKKNQFKFQLSKVNQMDRIDRIGLKWFELNRNGPKWTELTEVDSMDLSGPNGLTY